MFELTEAKKWLSAVRKAKIVNIFRTLPDHLASHLYLVHNFFWGGKNPHCMFHQSISIGLIWLIDFEVVYESFTVQTQFFVVRCISCTNAVCIVSWYFNLFLSWRMTFLDPPGGREKIQCCRHRAGPRTATIRFGHRWASLL